MNASAVQPRVEAERRLEHDRRRMCLLEYAYDRRGSKNRRSGFDRREILRILCHSCHRPLFGLRTNGRRLSLNPGYLEYLKEASLGKLYSCPHCNTKYEKCAIQLEQDSLLLRRVPEE